MLSGYLVSHVHSVAAKLFLTLGNTFVPRSKLEHDETFKDFAYMSLKHNC